MRTPRPTTESTGDRPTLDGLRSAIRRLERRGRPRAVLPIGVEAIDSRLPDGGLPLGRVHEVVGDPSTGAMTGFIAHLAAHLARGFSDDRGVVNGRGAGSGHDRTRAVLWTTVRPDLHAPGLATLGLTPDLLLVAAIPRVDDRLWAVEEAARSGALAAVIADLTDLRTLDPGRARRLQLAAEAGSTTVFLAVRPPPRATTSPPRSSDVTGLAPAIATTRWRVAPAPGRPRLLSTGLEEPGVGAPAWRLDLLRARGGRPTTTTVVRDWDTGDLVAIADASDATVSASGATAVPARLPWPGHSLPYSGCAAA